MNGIDPGKAAAIRVEVAARAGDPRAEAILRRMAEQGFQVRRAEPPESPPGAVTVVPAGPDRAGTLLVARSLMAQGYPVEMVEDVPESTGIVRVLLPER